MLALSTGEARTFAGALRKRAREGSTIGSAPPTSRPRPVAAVGHEGDACRPGDPSFDLWLRDCRGFRVITPSGRLGTVEHPSYDDQPDPVGLLVRTGFLRRALTEVAREEIEWIIPAGRRILLRRARS